MDTPFLDVRLSGIIVQAGLSESFGWNANDVLFCAIAKPELGFNSMFPFAFHDFPDACLTQAVPLLAKSGFADGFEGFIDKNASTETAWMLGGVSLHFPGFDRGTYLCPRPLHSSQLDRLD